MHRIQKYLEFFAALAGFLSVLAGALAAHKTQDIYTAHLLEQASVYGLVHSVAILALCARQEKSARIACLFFIFGILFFCGGLAFKGLAGTGLGPIVPIGGTCLMLGWLALMVRSLI